MSFATINPLATLVPPADAQAEPKAQPVADAAHTLCAQFAVAESTQSRTVAVWTLSRILTCSELDDALTRALKLAADSDAAPVEKGGAGWKAPEGAKGRDKYGPRQSSLASLASNIRQVFGACKIDPECIVSLPQSGGVNPDLFPNWSRAYALARQFLAEKGIDWTGNNVEAVKAAKEHKREASATIDAEAAVMAKHPQKEGETLAQYRDRIAPMVAEFIETATAAAVLEAAKKEYTRLVKVYGDNADAIVQAMMDAIQAD